MEYTNAYYFLSNTPKEKPKLLREKEILKEFKTLLNLRYEPVLKELARQHHIENIKFKMNFMKNSKLAEKDLDLIIAAIESTDAMADKRILEIKIINKSEVEVHTGFIKGPLHGGGMAYTLEKKIGKWIIVSKSSWMS